MQGISPALEVAVVLAVSSLKEERAPTSIGYNDMAVMIAYGQSEMGMPTVDREMVAKFLSRHPAVPTDARMAPEAVQQYLDVLVDRNLLDRQSDPSKYRMRDDTSMSIVAHTDKLKSGHIEEFLFHGFRLHSAWAIEQERRECEGGRAY